MSTLVHGGSRAGATSPPIVCTFRVGDLHIGIDVMLVQEVIRRQESTRVPLAPAAIHGLVNLRGEIVTTIDLRPRFDLPERASGAETMNVVICTPDGPLALMVDDIGDVVDVDESLIVPPPATLAGPRRELLTGVLQLDRDLLLLIDLDRVLDPTAFARPDHIDRPHHPIRAVDARDQKEHTS